jgi:hypothetical protein
MEGTETESTQHVADYCQERLYVCEGWGGDRLVRYTKANENGITCKASGGIEKAVDQLRRGLSLVQITHTGLHAYEARPYIVRSAVHKTCNKEEPYKDEVCSLRFDLCSHAELETPAHVESSTWTEGRRRRRGLRGHW